MNERERLPSLDSLRGIAALTVVIHHTLTTLPAFWAVYTGAPASRLARIMAFSPLHLLWDGHQAVLVFFVLSGFVLSLPYWQGRA
ncbi:MAG: acyltransferase family protein, partial [Stellaceae bacterium]